MSEVALPEETTYKPATSEDLAALRLGVLAALDGYGLDPSQNDITAHRELTLNEDALPAEAKDLLRLATPGHHDYYGPTTTSYGLRLQQEAAPFSDGDTVTRVEFLRRHTPEGPGNVDEWSVSYAAKANPTNDDIRGWRSIHYYLRAPENVAAGAPPLRDELFSPGYRFNETASPRPISQAMAHAIVEMSVALGGTSR